MLLVPATMTLLGEAAWWLKVANSSPLTLPSCPHRTWPPVHVYNREDAASLSSTSCVRA
jgi:uncharacterized membrane protein YdfJ with MMPL/SSD domain